MIKGKMRVRQRSVGDTRDVSIERLRDSKSEHFYLGRLKF